MIHQMLSRCLYILFIPVIVIAVYVTQKLQQEAWNLQDELVLHVLCSVTTSQIAIHTRCCLYSRWHMASGISVDEPAGLLQSTTGCSDDETMNLHLLLISVAKFPFPSNRNVAAFGCPLLWFVALTTMEHVIQQPTREMSNQFHDLWQRWSDSRSESKSTVRPSDWHRDRKVDGF